jgi:hypothetical protein
MFKVGFIPRDNSFVVGKVIPKETYWDLAFIHEISFRNIKGYIKGLKLAGYQVVKI